MKVAIGSLTDKRGNKQVFEDLAAIFEQHEYENDPRAVAGFESLMAIERQMQDLEDLNESASDGYIFLYPVLCCSNFLKLWRRLLLSSEGKTSFERFVTFLNVLTQMLLSMRGHKHTVDSMKAVFADLFNSIIDVVRSSGLVATANDVIFCELKEESEESLYSSLGLPVINISQYVVSDGLRHNKVTSEYKAIPSQETVYLWEMELWINSVNAGTANKFMYHIASVLSYIDDVDIEIEHVTIGSLFQRWGVKIKGFFAKKRTKDILEKGVKAAVSYALDQHIEPIEKCKAEKVQIEENTRRMMTTAQVNELHELMLEEKKEDVKAKRLANLEKAMDLGVKISDLLAKGLLEFDDDYRIMINQMLLIKQKDKVLKLGEIDRIDENEREVDHRSGTGIV